MLYSQTSQSDYKDLCRMDVLGLADVSENDQRFVHTEFKEQLYQHQEAWYETGLQTTQPCQITSRGVYKVLLS